MRRILILFFLIFFFSFYNNVSAIVFTCDEYYDENNHKVDITMTWDDEKEFNVNSNPISNIQGIKNTDHFNQFIIRWGKKGTITSNANIAQSLYTQVKKTHGCNDNMYVCLFNENTAQSAAGLITDGYDALFTGLFTGDWNSAADKVKIADNTVTAMVMTEQEYVDNYKKYEGGKVIILNQDKIEDLENSDHWGITKFFGTIWYRTEAVVGWGDSTAVGYKEISCQKAYYNGPYIGVNINCTNLANFLVEYQGKVAEYSNCGKDDVVCKADAVTELNNSEAKLKSECSSLEKNLDYTSEQQECLDACFKLNDTLNDYRKGTDLGDVDSSKLNQCGISDKIVNFISKVVKWIKYIAPVIVIILGILDFIKAIASSSEDEMKKAQGRFIKRVLAAAILFLVPFIIQFILEAFHLVNNNPFCSLF